MRKRSNLFYLQLIFLLAVMFLTVYSTYAAVSANAYLPEVDTKKEETYPSKDGKKHNFSENLKLSAEINEYVKTIKGVSDSECFVMFDQCYVAFKSEDLVNKEAVETLKKEIEAGICKKFDKVKKVFATNDLNAFVKMQNIIKRANSGEKITDLKKDIIELKKIFHGDKPFKHFKKRK